MSEWVVERRFRDEGYAWTDWEDHTLTWVDLTQVIETLSVDTVTLKHPPDGQGLATYVEYRSKGKTAGELIQDVAQKAISDGPVVVEFDAEMDSEGEAWTP